MAAEPALSKSPITLANPWGVATSNSARERASDTMPVACPDGDRHRKTDMAAP
jgi:hypothetical protein